MTGGNGGAFLAEHEICKEGQKGLQRRRRTSDGLTGAEARNCRRRQLQQLLSKKTLL
jgi:hypothetical protein